MGAGGRSADAHRFGSSTSFVDQKLAVKLHGVQRLQQPCHVRVVDKGELSCSSIIPRCLWSSQHQEFFIDMKILSLGTYNAILGMDWLEEHNPMTMDWIVKHASITTPKGLCMATI